MEAIDRVDYLNGRQGSTFFGFKALSYYDIKWDKNNNVESPAAYLYMSDHEGMIGSIRDILERSYETNRKITL